MAHVNQLWTLFSDAQYEEAKGLFAPNVRVTWPTSREYYETVDAFIAVNEVFGEHWTFEIVALEETLSGKVMSVVYVTKPGWPDSFYATSIFTFAENVIVSMDTFWAFEDKQPEWRKELSKVY
uniref:hypothetical protein n=1 Tax=Thaumasiovibrio occultus TaxID=1891184 RepID=UPI000B3537F8|nr:hypothetical protein [Thaumasiovibrio occultus]